MTLQDPMVGLEWQESGHEFKVLEFIAEGAFGRVYKIQMDDEILALKFLNPNKLNDKNRETTIRRFRREAKVIASVDHDNAVRTKFTGEHPHLGPYLIMEFVEGSTSLADVIRRMPYKGTQEEQQKIFAQGEKYLRQGLRVLNYLRRKNIIHRDLKPENFMISQEGIVKLADFGLGKITGASSHQTQTGASMGTPWYLSPEQAQDSKAVTSQCDIYGLGATFYHVLLGRPMFEKDTALLALQAHVFEEPKWPQEIDEVIDFPERLEDLLMNLVSKRPEDRMTPEEALKWIDGHDPEPRSLEMEIEQIIELEKPLWRRISAETFDQYVSYVLDRDLLPVKEWKASESSIQEPLTENMFRRVAEYEEQYEISMKEMEAMFAGIDVTLLTHLAELHESVGYKTSRYFPDFGNRRDHFLLAYRYMKQTGIEEEKRSILRKLTALENRRVKRFPQLLSKSHNITMIQQSPQELRELATASTMDVEEASKALQPNAETVDDPNTQRLLPDETADKEPEIQPLQEREAKKSNKKVIGLFAGGIAMAALAIGGIGYSSVSGKYSDLQDRIKSAEKKVEQRAWGSVFTELQAAEKLEKSITNSTFGFAVDVTPQTKRRKELMATVDKYKGAVREFADVAGKLGQLEKSYEALVAKVDDKDKYFEAVSDIQEFKDDVNMLQVAAEKQKEWMPEKVGTLNAKVDEMLGNIPDFEKKISDKADEDIKKAKELLDKAKARFKDLEDITREGVVDTSSVVKQQLDDAGKAIYRAKKAGKAVDFEIEYNSSAESFAKKQERISWYSKLVADSDKNSAKALELGKYHFDQKPYFEKKNVDIAKAAFGKAGEQGKKYLKVLDLLNQVRDPKNQVTLVRGVSKSDVDSFASQVNAYKQNPDKDRRELSVKMLQPIAAGLGMEISELVRENGNLNKLSNKGEEVRKQLADMRKQFLSGLQARVKEAESYFEGIEPQVNPKIVQEFKDALDKAGYKGIVQRQYVRAAMPK